MVESILSGMTYEEARKFFEKTFQDPKYAEEVMNILREYLPDECIKCIFEEYQKLSRKVQEIKEYRGFFNSKDVFDILLKEFNNVYGWEDFEALIRTEIIKEILFLAPCGLNLKKKIGEERFNKMLMDFYEYVRRRDGYLKKAIMEFSERYNNIIVFCGVLHGAVGLLLQNVNVSYCGVDKYVKQYAKEVLYYGKKFLDKYQIEFLEKLLASEYL